MIRVPQSASGALSDGLVIAVFVVGLVILNALALWWLSREEGMMTVDKYTITLDLGPVGFVENVRLELIGVITATTASNAAAQLAEVSRVALWAAERLRGSQKRGER